VRARSAILSACLLLSAVVLAAQSGAAALSAADADRFAEKYNRLMQGAQAAGQARKPVSTTVTEQEVNAFLRLRGQALLPTGVIDPSLAALGDGRLQGWATVDLDAVRLSKERGWLDPMRMLRGRLPVTAIGVLHTQGGSARFDLESASVSGIPIPKSMLQELVTYYTRGDTYPQGVNLDAPVALPAGIREITVQTGRAVIVQ
jgi:hypothetical protein